MYHYRLLLSFHVFLLSASRAFGNCEDVDSKKHLFPITVFTNTYILVLVLVLAWILLLLFLGIIKALVGLCYPPVGLCGLSILMELPVPLEHYFEPELQKHEVHYDFSGWPIHPFTNERTVRVVSKTTEVSLNTIFFLAYPMVVCNKLCGICSFKTTDRTSTNNSSCYESVATIRLLEHSNKKEGKGPVIDMYYDDDMENEDTQYVLNQLQQSKASLEKCYHQEME